MTYWLKRAPRAVVLGIATNDVSGESYERGAYRRITRVAAVRIIGGRRRQQAVPAAEGRGPRRVEINVDGLPYRGASRTISEIVQSAAGGLFGPDPGAGRGRRIRTTCEEVGVCPRCGRRAEHRVPAVAGADGYYACESRLRPVSRTYEDPGKLLGPVMGFMRSLGRLNHTAISRDDAGRIDCVTFQYAAADLPGGGTGAPATAPELDLWACGEGSDAKGERG